MAVNPTDPTHETIARRAYEIWENRGRPMGADLETWLEAERELMPPPSPPSPPRIETRRMERTENRAETRRAREPLPLPGPREGLHYIVLLDRGHLRIYAEDSPYGTSTPRFVPVESVDFAEGVQSYSERDTDQAGRFPGSKGRPGGMSIDERLPMKRERDHQLVRRMADRINAIIQQHANATWDYAAGPELHQAVLDQLAPAVRRRLRITIKKDLVHQPLVRMRTHFSEQPETATAR